MTEQEGMRRGRPILVLARVTNDVPLSMSISLDVETWLDEGLIDLVQVGNWLNFETPMRPLIDLGMV